MKSTINRALSPRNENRYLKPGALAQLRDSRIRKPQISLYQLVAASLAAAETASLNSEASAAASAVPTDAGAPCFDLRRFRSPRCLGRKKLVAVTPIFACSSPQP